MNRCLIKNCAQGDATTIHVIDPAPPMADAINLEAQDINLPLTFHDSINTVATHGNTKTCDLPHLPPRHFHSLTPGA